jgi:hypothetical protein
MLSTIIKAEKLGEEIYKTCNAFHYAGAIALTKTAKHAQQDVREIMQDLFTIRNKWTISGVRITPAKAKDDAPFAEVYSKDWYMPIHDVGGVRQPKGKFGFWIPKDIRRAAGIDFKKIIPASMRPKNLLKPKSKARIHDNRPFLAKTKGGMEGIFVRTGKARTPVEMLYMRYDKGVNIKSRRWFMDTVSASYDKWFEQEYNEALLRQVERAIASVSDIF